MAEQLRRPFEKFVDSPYYSVYVFEKWVERCEKCIACQGRYFEKETVTAPPEFRLGVIRRVHELFKRPSLLRRPEKGSFKMTINETLTTVRRMKITALLRYPHHYNLA
jgi:hypothetical protein